MGRNSQYDNRPKGRMSSALEEVEFLAGSPNRVRVLDLIRAAPRTRDDLKEATDVSRVTLSRILGELEDRNWIERPNHQYKATPRGRFVAGEFTQLLGNLEAAEDLDDILWWLPTDQFGFDLDCLRDAEVSVQSRSDHTAAIRHVAALVDGAAHVRGIATGVSREVIDAFWDLTVTRDGRLDLVLEEFAIDIVRTDAGLRQRFRELMESGQATVYRYEGSASVIMMMLTEDTVVLCGHDDEGPPPGTIQTTNATVHSWAESYFTTIQAVGSPLQIGAFTP